MLKFDLPQPHERFTIVSKLSVSSEEVASSLLAVCQQGWVGKAKT